MVVTTILNTDYTPYNTGQYKRVLPYYNAAPNGSVDWAYIAPAASASTRSDNVNAIAFNNGVSYGSEPVSLISDNTKSGITFLVFNKNPRFENISLNAGPNSTDAPGGFADGADSIYISTASTNQPIAFVNNTIITGDTTTDSQIDDDLVVFGSDSSLDPNKNAPNVYAINLKDSSGKAAFASTINYLTGGLDALQLTIKGNSVSTGNGKDTLIFANVAATSQIGGTASGDQNLFDLGRGADFVYFSTPSQIRDQNTINLGKVNGAPDAQSDTLLFNYNSAQKVGSDLTGLNGTSTFMTIKGFVDGQDYLYYNGQFYTSAADVTTATSNRIRFS